MNYLKIARLNKIFILISTVVSVNAFADSTNDSLSTEDIRMYMGGCPSQIIPISNQTSKTDLSLLSTVAGKLIDRGIDSLGALLIKAGTPRIKEDIVGLNLNELQRSDTLGKCLIIIEGKFSNISNPVLLNKYQSYYLSDQNIKEIKPTDDKIACDSSLTEINDLEKSLRQKLSAEELQTRLNNFKIADSIREQTNKAIDSMNINTEFSTQKMSIKNNLNKNCIQLNEPPRTYMEYLIVPNKTGSALAFTPIFTYIDKPKLKNSLWRTSKQRDLVINATLSTSDNISTKLGIFNYKGIEYPFFRYQDPLMIKSCTNYNAEIKDHWLCSNNNSSAWLNIPKGTAPYRLELSITESENGYKFLKELGEIINSNSTQIKTEVKQQIIPEVRDEANAKADQQLVTDSQNIAANIKTLTIEMTTFNESIYEPCRDYSGNKNIDKYTLFLNYKKSRDALLSKVKNAGLDIDEFNKEFPELSSCPAAKI